MVVYLFITCHEEITAFIYLLFSDKPLLFFAGNIIAAARCKISYPLSI